jgi:hypothetical protein
MKEVAALLLILLGAKPDSSQVYALSNGSEKNFVIRSCDTSPCKELKLQLMANGVFKLSGDLTLDEALNSVLPKQVQPPFPRPTITPYIPKSVYPDAPAIKVE